MDIVDIKGVYGVMEPLKVMSVMKNTPGIACIKILIVLRGFSLLLDLFFYFVCIKSNLFHFFLHMFV